MLIFMMKTIVSAHGITTITASSVKLFIISAFGPQK